MTNSGNFTPIPPQPRAPKAQNKPRSPVGQGGGGRYPNNRRSNNPQGRSGGNAGRQQPRRNQAPDNYNKYMNLAKEASASGDHIAAEGYYQHAEHYYRVMHPAPTA